MKIRKYFFLVYLLGILVFSLLGVRRLFDMGLFAYRWNNIVSHNLEIISKPVQFDSGVTRYIPLLAINRMYVRIDSEKGLSQNMVNWTPSDYYVERYIVLNHKDHEIDSTRVIVLLTDYLTGGSKCVEFIYEQPSYRHPKLEDFNSCSHFIDKNNMPNILEWEFARPPFFIPQGLLKEVFLFSIGWLFFLTVIVGGALFIRLIFRQVLKSIDWNSTK